MFQKTKLKDESEPSGCELSASVQLVSAWRSLPRETRMGDNWRGNVFYAEKSFPARLEGSVTAKDASIKETRLIFK